MSTESRFWSKVKRTSLSGDECWLWQAGIDKDGYGIFTVSNIKVRAHRMAYHLSHGELPAELEITHRCDVPGCCRPSHLRPATHQENMAEMAAKGRARSGQTKLNLVEAKVVLLLATNKDFSQKVIGSMFGVTQPEVSSILSGRRWPRAQEVLK